MKSAIGNIASSMMSRTCSTPARPEFPAPPQSLAYCKELNVELEVFINENKTSLVQDDDMLGGRPIRNIDYTTNMRGFMAELMAKAMSSDELNAPFTESEAETLLNMIRSFGDLNEHDIYSGSYRAGYAEGGVLKHGVQKDMIAFRDLLKIPSGPADDGCK